MEMKKLVPELRFKGFDGEWKKEPIGRHISLISGLAFKGEDISEDPSGIPILRGINITEGFIRHNEKIDRYFLGDTSKLDKIRVKEGDLVLGMDGSKVGKNSALVSKGDVDSLLIQRVARLREKKGSCLAFIYQHINSIRFHKYVDVVNTSSGIPHISSKQINDFRLLFPNEVEEQQKIASFLSAVDEKIQQLTKKKELLEHYKKGVMQQLFSGKLRFKDADGKDYPDWKPRKMSEVLFEHKLNSTGKEEVFSVSVHKGLINQVEHLGRVFAAKNTDNYNLVQPGDIVYTKSPTGSFPLGIIKQSKIDKNVIVSPLYGIFTPETPGLGYMFNVYFESPINTQNYLASIIQKGAKNTINITNTTFLSKKMKLPTSKAEQNEIGNFLKELDTKIERVNQQITQTQTFKKGLLQQMFV